MEKRHGTTPPVLRLDQWRVKEVSNKSSKLICANELLNELLLSNFKNYFNNGIALFDIEESDLDKIMLRVVEKMVFDGHIEKFDIENVSDVVLFKQQFLEDESLESEENKSDGISPKHIIEIEKLIGSDDITTVRNQPIHFSKHTALVMVCNTDFILEPTLSFVRLSSAICFPESKKCELPVRFILVLLGPAKEALSNIEKGSTLCTLMTDEEFRVEADKAKSKNDILLAFEKVYSKAQAELSKDETSNLLNIKKINQHPVNSLLKTNRLWGGLINDVTRRLPQYKSDICDGLNRQVIAASIFLYFGVLSTAITFGGLMSSKTNNLMGISETLLSTSLVGIVFHLFASQPLIIVGGTGPLLLFDEALFQLCQLYDLDFLTVRIYIGIWLGLIAIAIAAFDGCVYLRLFTRFTQELFASLISLIFMMEAIFKIIEVFRTYPISVANNGTVSHNPWDAMSEILLETSDRYEPNTALFCAILSVGTFVLAYCLRAFRNSHFLGRSIRRAIGDFGVPIAISAFVYLSSLVPQIYTEKLIVPEGLSPTDPNARHWLIPFNPLPVWLPFISAIAAFLVYVLIFMETQISELILESRGLKKGSGFHLDIVIICLVNVVCGFLGMPWQSGATIRSVTHVSAVSTTGGAKGESKGFIVREQRVSGLIISLSVGFSVVMAPILRIIPVSILYGVFFYMGIVSISGVQFLHRIRLLFTPTKYHGTAAYVQRVPTWKMHIFTSVQLLASCVLWLVKSSRFSLALPFVLLLMIPLRQKIASYYTAAEMAALDGSLPEMDVKNEPDFYEQSHLPG